MYFFLPYMIAAVFSVISAAKGHDYKSVAFWKSIGVSCVIMVIIRDILHLLGIVSALP